MSVKDPRDAEQKANDAFKRSPIEATRASASPDILHGLSVVVGKSAAARVAGGSIRASNTVESAIKTTMQPGHELSREASLQEQITGILSGMDSPSEPRRALNHTHVEPRNAHFTARTFGDRAAPIKPLVTPPADGSTVQVAYGGQLPMPVTSAIDLGKLVRAARRRLKLSQQAFGDLAGVGRRFVSELEAGKATLEIGKTLACCAAAGVDLLAYERVSG